MRKFALIFAAAASLVGPPARAQEPQAQQPQETDFAPQLARVSQRVTRELNQIVAERALALLEQHRAEHRQQLAQAVAELARLLRCAEGLPREVPAVVWRRIAELAAQVEAAAGALAVGTEG
jgi:hypothetical protein